MFKGIGFSHAFQPIIDISKSDIVSYEVLLRGLNNEAPWMVFDNVAKQDWISFDQYSREQALSLASRLGLGCSINLNFTPGAILFDDGRCIQQTLEKSREYAINPRQLIVEITESEFIDNIELLSIILNRYRKENIVIAIDDFGAGYAGLKLLADIQPDLIKIDMSLLRNIHNNGPRQSIVRAINEVCLDLGIDVLAEGVETEAEFNWLRNLGITLYQGNFFAKPAYECLLAKKDIPQLTL